jgi:hypothetical protein
VNAQTFRRLGACPTLGMPSPQLQRLNHLLTKL